MSLHEELNKLSQRVKRQLRQMRRSEAVTVDAAVKPFIYALGYDVFDTREVFPQYRILRSDAVDIAILRDGEPIIFVEAKSASVDLGHKQWKQLFEYFNASKSKVRVGILTNGIEWKFYTDSVRSNIMDDEPFLALDLQNPDPQVVNDLRCLTKSEFDSERIAEIPRRRELIDGLRRAMDKLVESLDRLYAEDLTSSRVSANEIEQAASFVNSARDVLDKEQPTPPAPPPEYIPIYGYYEGHRFEAELRLESVRKGIFISSKAVRYNGELMTSGAATWHAIRTVKPSFDSTVWDKEKINSWEFWRVVDPLDGSERILRLVAGWKDNRDHALYQRILST